MKLKKKYDKRKKIVELGKVKKRKLLRAGLGRDCEIATSRFLINWKKEIY